MFKLIERCRVCGNPNLTPVLDLGTQAFTGIFPRSRSQTIGKMPLELVKCTDEGEPIHCGLLQLRHTADLPTLYGDAYGYRSSLNSSMVTHLHAKVKSILDLISLQGGDFVLDIGSNDGTLLSAFPSSGIHLIGIDPTAAKFRQFYPDHITVLPDFFSAGRLHPILGRRKIKVITSIAMFYDLEDPMSFMREIAELLDDQGIWVLEQSYMPRMLAMTAYDTVCHEHLEYYALKQIKWMADRVGLRIIDVEFNQINGGSFSVRIAKERSPLRSNEAQIRHILASEDQSRLNTLEPFLQFRQQIWKHRDDLRALLNAVRAEGKTICGYGASTKGNVILQFCGISERDLPCIADVNPDKFGAFTPGTQIPIVSEEDARKLKPEYFLVFPWHFRDTILLREHEYLSSGGRLIFPLPSIEVVDRAN